MPDWFYRTVSRPVLFSLPAKPARDFALGFMGTLARIPLGRFLIDFLGHMAPDERLRCTHFGLTFDTPIGLGPSIDNAACALPALSRFGFGLVEVGSVRMNGQYSGPSVTRDSARKALRLGNEALDFDEFAARAHEAQRLRVPLMVRLGSTAPPKIAAEECRGMLRDLAPHAKLFSLDTLREQTNDSPPEAWADHVRAVKNEARELARPLLLCVPSDLDASRLALVDAAVEAGVDGLHVDGALADGSGTLVGLPAREASLAQVHTLRKRFGVLPIIASGGVHEPGDALDLRAAGADLIQLDTGLVFTGPGLPKRINELFLYELTHAMPPEKPPRAPEMSWFWTLLMGSGMVFGSLLALLTAATVTVLPYDLTFIGLTRDELSAINPHLLHFMAHDRVSLAGTMVATGIMYVGLSIFGIRRGHAWARNTVLFSATTGFASFFLFLGFGYLDPFHAFVTAVLFQFLLLGLHSKLGHAQPAMRPELRGDLAWRLSLWGQLLLIIHGAGLLGAGAIISSVGVTHVFVPEDLAFMNTTAEALKEAHPRLVPLIAHDRATFGGMLLASGWVFMLPALWGFKRGASWLWSTYMLAGPVGYAAAIGVHITVGYTDAMHLAPAFGGLGLFVLGMVLSFPYLTQEDKKPKP